MAARDRDSMHSMGFRFRRSFRLIPGIRLKLSKSGVSTSIGTRGAWLTIGRRGTRAPVGIPGTELSYSEQSPWKRPKPDVQAVVPGFDVAELPLEEIDVSAVSSGPSAAFAPAAVHPDDDEAHSDPRLLPIVLALVALITALIVVWASVV
jgi:hypothetical protein